MISGPDTLLIVDDDTANCDLMLRRLRKRGFEASLASDGRSALEWINSHQVDLVLLDVQMPDMDGVQVLKTLRQTYTPAQLPIIMVTGKASSDDVVSALAAGANDYVTKPIDFPVVLARIQNQLSRKRAEEALRESEERYALASRGANDGLWDWDVVRNKMYFSPRWKAMLGWNEDEISDDPDEWFRRIHPDDVDRVRADIAAHLDEATPHYEDEYRMLHRDGNYLWMLGRGLAVRNSSGKAYRMAGSQTDITRGKVVDVLTGLPNRVLFMDRLSRSFERARRRKDKTLALIFLDLDSFKLINDSLGHMMGDQLLVAIAGRLEATLRSTDSVARFGRNHTIARLGGDEFTILLEDISSALDATRVAERIAHDLSMPFMVAGQELFPTASIGIALYNPSYQSPQELLRDADTAMYSAKSLGKGRYEIFDADMRANAIARLQLETELRRGIERKEFENFYQVIVSLETGRILGFEALVRWKNSSRGIVPPKEFILVAEETGLIVPLGQWVLETACRQMRIWQSRFANDPPLMISVNLSARHFLQADLLQHCRAVLHDTQLSYSSLNLEVTESATMPNPESAIELMNQLKSLGIKIAIDDFGTGYSSLSYLHRFPLDSLKIDQVFVSRIMEDDEIVRTIITLGRNLGLKVIAEGVENLEQVMKLKELGCEYAQGYYFSVPVSAEGATDLLLAQKHWPDSLKTACERWPVGTGAIHRMINTEFGPHS
ncbi:MAG: EAL domain-containing protein [Acidobacteria bacterium]|nr:EAL domain-containing protein [Acidobacteriota bacterium]